MTESIAHPREAAVKVCGGTKEVRIRPWSMATRARVRPRLLALLDKVQGREEHFETFAELYEFVEDEALAIAEVSAELPKGLEWDELDWEDGIPIVQAVWQVCVMRGEDGGILGKANRVLSDLTGVSVVAQLGNLWEQGKAAEGTRSSKSRGSRSSRAGGGRARKNSAKR